MTDMNAQAAQVDYKVVKNNEDQYSIYFVDREVPNGWEEVGKQGSKEECLDYIREVWTDMTPKSLRGHQAADGKGASKKKVTKKRASVAAKKKSSGKKEGGSKKS